MGKRGRLSDCLLGTRVSHRALGVVGVRVESPEMDECVEWVSVLKTSRCSRYIIADAVESLDPALEFLRIAERYRQMSDEELLVIEGERAGGRAELTDLAQQALAGEFQSRGLKVEEANREKAPEPITPPPAFFEHESAELKGSSKYEYGTSYDEDRKLVKLCTVWSLRDALQVQSLLDVAGIPFFMGPEKATGVDAVTSNFSNGVEVTIMQIGLPWAGPTMRHYEPADDPDAEGEKAKQDDELLIRCPRCHSTDVVFQDRVLDGVVAEDEAADKFEWTCDSCGHKWVDDGVVMDG